MGQSCCKGAAVKPQPRGLVHQESKVLQFKDPVTQEVFDTNIDSDLVPLCLPCGHTCSRKTVRQVRLTLGAWSGLSACKTAQVLIKSVYIWALRGWSGMFPSCGALRVPEAACWGACATGPVVAEGKLNRRLARTGSCSPGSAPGDGCRDSRLATCDSRAISEWNGCKHGSCCGESDGAQCSSSMHNALIRGYPLSITVRSCAGSGGRQVLSSVQRSTLSANRCSVSAKSQAHWHHLCHPEPQAAKSSH